MGTWMTASNLMLQAGEVRRAGDLDTAIALTREQVGVTREHLELAELHNRLHPDPLDIDPIAGPLINALTDLADFLQVTGDVDQAESMRKEAIDLAHKYFDAAGDAKEQRRWAAALTSQGRFAEALSALARARDFFEGDGDLVEMTRTTIDLVDILQWLGDYDRAASELEHAEQTIRPVLEESGAGGSFPMREVVGGLMSSYRRRTDG